MSEALVVERRARDSQRWFAVWMAGAFVLIAFGGFAPTYWLQLPAGTFVGSPLLHLHGLLFSAWTLSSSCKRYLPRGDGSRGIAPGVCSASHSRRPWSWWVSRPRIKG